MTKEKNEITTIKSGNNPVTPTFNDSIPAVKDRSEIRTTIIVLRRVIIRHAPSDHCGIRVDQLKRTQFELVDTLNNLSVLICSGDNLSYYRSVY